MTDDLQAALRQISGTVGALDSTVKHMVATWQSQEASASAGRRALHAKLDALGREVTVMSNQVAGAMKDIAAMKPIVDRVRELKSEARGAGKLARGLWAFGGFLIAVAGWGLSHLHVGLVVGQ